MSCCTVRITLEGGFLMKGALYYRTDVMVWGPRGIGQRPCEVLIPSLRRPTKISKTIQRLKELILNLNRGPNPQYNGEVVLVSGLFKTLY
jgi:hypothetical protein